MGRPFAVDRLSKRAKDLIENLYFDKVPTIKIADFVKEKTGEEITVKSLYWYCSQKLKGDWRIEAIRKYRDEVLGLMKDYSSLSRSKIELAGFLVAVLGVQHQMISRKLDEAIEIFKRLSQVVKLRQTQACRKARRKKPSKPSRRGVMGLVPNKSAESRVIDLPSHNSQGPEAHFLGLKNPKIENGV